MQSSALTRSIVRVAIAAATVASLGAPAAFAAANQSATITPFASFFANVTKNMGTSNTNTANQTNLFGPANQNYSQTSTALTTGITTVTGGASNTVNFSQFGF